MANGIDWRTMQKPWCQPEVWQKCLGRTSTPIGVEEIVEATSALRAQGRLLRLKQPRLQVCPRLTRVQMYCFGNDLGLNVLLTRATRVEMSCFGERLLSKCIALSK